MGDNFLDGMITDLDLNQEPSDQRSGQVLGFGSFLNDLETVHNRIEERIQQLEAVTARVRERNRWRRAQNSVEANNMLVDQNVNVEGSRDAEGLSFVPGRGCKRDSSHLVAKALAMDSEVRKVDKDGQGFFDCNICLDMAQEPVLTCCGHLYCWMCFYRLPYVYSTMKECPVCKGEVTDANVIPIYGNGNSDCEKELESGLKIPPRPKAHRIESVRQQRVSRGLSHIPVAEALRRIRASIGIIGLGDQPQQQLSGGSNVSSIMGSQESQNPNSNGQVPSRMFARVLSESSASLSSELDNAQRIFEGLAASSTDSVEQRNSSRGLSIGDDVMRDGDFFGRDDTFTGAEHQVLDSTTEINSPASIPSSSQATDVSGAVVQLENLTTATTGEINLHALHSSSWRRFSFLRLSDINSVVSRETRRRRLN